MMDMTRILEENIPNTKVKNILLRNEGYNNKTFEIITEKKEKYIIKIFEKWNHNMESEIWSLKKIQTTPLAKYSARLIAQGIYSDRGYILQERLPGEPLSREMGKISDLGKIFIQLGNIKGKLSKITLNDFGEIKINGIVKKYDSLKEFRLKQITQWVRELERQKIDPIKLNQIKKEIPRVIMHLSKDVGPCLCHGDTSFGNILVKKINNTWKVTGFIDLEFSHAGGTVSDWHSSPKTFESFLEHLDFFQKGFAEEAIIPESFLKILWAFQFFQSVNWLRQVPSMEWPKLNKEERDKRREKLNRFLIDHIKKSINNI